MAVTEMARCLAADSARAATSTIPSAQGWLDRLARSLRWKRYTLATDVGIADGTAELGQDPTESRTVLCPAPRLVHLIVCGSFLAYALSASPPATAGQSEFTCSQW